MRPLGSALSMLLGVTFAVGGCAAMEGKRIRGVTAQLVDAGFTRTALADPRQAADGLPPGELIERHEGGAIRYLFADPKGCQCLYTGSEAAYQRYRVIAENQRLADQMTTAPGRQQQRYEQYGRP